MSKKDRLETHGMPPSRESLTKMVSLVRTHHLAHSCIREKGWSWQGRGGGGKGEERGNIGGGSLH